MRNIFRPALLIAGCVLVATLSVAQFGRGGGAWNTAGADAQRTSWARTDNRINATSMPGFMFLWKVRINNDAKQAYSLSPAVMVDSYIGYRGFRSYAFAGGASNTAVALDSDVGRVEWQQNLGTATNGTATCPGAMSAGVTRPSALAPVAAPQGAGGGRGGGQGAQSGVSAPEAGAITIGQGRGGGGGGRGAAGASGAGRGGPGGGGFAGPGGPGGASGGRGGGGGGGGRGGGAPDAVYAVSTDGMLHTMYISNGTAARPPVRFLPPNANASGLLLVNNVIYAATSGNCGGVPNGIWAMDTSATPPTPMHWATNGGGIAGTYGPALGTDGTVYAGTTDGDYTPTSLSDSVVALDSKTLQVKDFFTPGKSDFTSTPVVFQYKEKDLIAVANKDGHIYLLDSAALGGPDHKTPLVQSPQYANSGADAGALASWLDPAGTRWILVGATGATKLTASNGAVTNGAIVAFKLVDQNGKLSLEPGWVSHDIVSPLPPIVVNGIVFGLSGGAAGKSAVLYAFNSATGKELFNSGSTITGTVRSGSLAASAGQMYLATADSTIYVFGVPLVPPALAAK